MTNPANPLSIESPATLVAIVHAARQSGDRSLERGARRELRDRYGISLSYQAPSNTVEAAR